MGREHDLQPVVGEQGPDDSGTGKERPDLLLPCPELYSPRMESQGQQVAPTFLAQENQQEYIVSSANFIFCV